MLAQRSTRCLATVVVSTALLGLRREFDHVVDSEDGDGGLGGELEALHFGNGGLQDAGLFVITHDAFEEIQAHPLEIGVLRFDLHKRRIAGKIAKTNCHSP